MDVKTIRMSIELPQVHLGSYNKSYQILEFSIRYTVMDRRIDWFPPAQGTLECALKFINALKKPGLIATVDTNRAKIYKEN